MQTKYLIFDATRNKENGNSCGKKGALLPHQMEQR